MPSKSNTPLPKQKGSLTEVHSPDGRPKIQYYDRTDVINGQSTATYLKSVHTEQ